jgi:hypothetical protein
MPVYKVKLIVEGSDVGKYYIAKVGAKDSAKKQVGELFGPAEKAEKELEAIEITKVSEAANFYQHLSWLVEKHANWQQADTEVGDLSDLINHGLSLSPKILKDLCAPKWA